MKSIIIPKYAKEASMRALDKRGRLVKSKRFGLTKEEADALKIDSGVERAKQIIRNYKLSNKDAKKVARFYSRFKNCTTPKCEGAINLWGGRKWGKRLYEEFYE